MAGEIDPSELLISDRDRESAVTMLGTAMGQGRITPVEFSERCEQAWAARTRAELLAVLVDLPGAPPPELASLVLDVSFGQVRRGGTWPVPELIKIVGMGQRTTLDFTDAVFHVPSVTIQVTGNLSTTRVILPLDAEVDTDRLELVAGSVRERGWVPRRDRTTRGPGRLRRLLPGTPRDQHPPPPAPGFILLGRATLASVTLWYPRPPKRR